MFAGTFQRLAAWLTPPDPHEGCVRIEQLRAIAQNNVQAAFTNPLIAILLAVIDLQWVPLLRISWWFALIVLSAGWMWWGSKKALAHETMPDQAGDLTLKMIAWTFPSMAIWFTMVLFVWTPEDVLNNGFLITFMFACMAACVPQSGLCRYVALPGLAIAILILATHTLTGSPTMDWLGPILQTLAGLLICNLSLTYETTYKAVVKQRLEKEALASELATAAQALAGARDTAQQASEAKSEFLANMSHELRTPLNAVIGFSDIIRNRTLGPVSPQKYGEYIEDIHKSGIHLLNLINNLLDLAKIEAGKRDLQETTIHLEQAAAAALRLVEMQARKGGVTLRTEIDGDLGLIADERAITQVLTNLLSNAVKFTRPGGSVTAFAHIVDGGGLALGVKDTGIGMEPEEIERALEPFAQVAHVTTVEGWGSGLGVPLVKALVEIHGGSFHIESHRGIGTCAWGEFLSTRTVRGAAITLNTDTTAIAAAS